MKNSLINVFIFFLLTLSVSNASVLTARDLGLAQSDHLQKEIFEKFYNNGEIDRSKIEGFKNQIIKAKELFVKNRLASVRDGQSLVKAEKKARKQKKYIAYDTIISRIEALDSEYLTFEKENSLRDILAIHYATKTKSYSGTIKEFIKMGVSLFFQKYHVPISDLKRPLPSNLVNTREKKYYTKSELKRLIKEGVDLSLIDPPNNHFWNRQENISEIDPITGFEKEGKIPTVLTFDKIKDSGTQPKFKAHEHFKDGSKLKWKVKIGRESQPEYVGAKLMKLLGYHFDESYVVEDLKVYFKSKKQFDKFIKKWVDRYFDFYTMPFNYIKEKGQDENGYFAVFYEALLEPRPKDTVRLGNLHLEEMGAYDRREIRAQLLLHALIGNVDYRSSRNSLIKLVKNQNTPKGYEMQELVQDLGYSFGFVWPNEPNEFGWSFLKKKGKKINIQYSNVEFFKSKKNPLLNTSYSDLKWLARYFVQITRDQLKVILKHSKWPYPVQKLILEKLTTRRNEVVKAFDFDGEVIDGKKISIWPEVNPKKFSDGEFIKDGALIKDYKPINKPYAYTDLFKVPSDLLGMGQSLMAMLYNITEEIPYHEMIKHPLEVSGFETTKFFVGAGVGFRFKREVTKNKDATEGPNSWITKDTLQIFGTVGAGLVIPVTETVAGFVEAKTLVGKQFEVTYHTPNIWEAMKGDIKKVASLPFKKKNIINQLKTGESYGSGIFIGIEFEEGMEYGPFQMFALGFEFEQKLKWLTKTEVLKRDEGKYEVTKAKSKEFTFGFATYLKLVSVLQIDFFSASIMVGESEGNTFYFDLQGDKSYEMTEAFHKLVFGKDMEMAKKMVPYSKIQMKYYENKWRFGFMVSHIGSQTNGMYKFIEMPDGTMKRSFDYKTVLDTNKLLGESNQFFEVNGSLEFSDPDLKNVTKQSLGVEYRVVDKETTFKEIGNYVRKVNTLVDDKRFVVDNFSENFLNNLGWVNVNLRMDFHEDALTCMFRRRKCEAKGPKAYVFDRKLKNISKIKMPAKKMERLGKFLRKQAFKPKRFKNVLDFVGRKNVSSEVLISGEYLQGKDAIYRKKGPKIPLAI